MTYLYVAYCKGQAHPGEEKTLWPFRHLNKFKTKDLGFKSGRNQNGPKFVDDTMYRKCVVHYTTLSNSLKELVMNVFFLHTRGLNWCYTVWQAY